MKTFLTKTNKSLLYIKIQLVKVKVMNLSNILSGKSVKQFSIYVRIADKKTQKIIERGEIKVSKDQFEKLSSNIDATDSIKKLVSVTGIAVNNIFNDTAI